MFGDQRRLLGRAAVLALVAGVLWAAPLQAQLINGNLLPTPRLTSVTPLGAKAGATVELRWTGTDLEDPEQLLFTHPGIKAEVIKPEAPKSPDPKKPLPTPPITKFKVSIAADVPVGQYDVRFVNKWGVSNPRLFTVSDLDEVEEKEPNNDDVQAQKVPFNTVVNGVIAAGTDVDYYAFPAKKGQRVVIHCATTSIDSRLSTELKLVSAAGRELAYHRATPGNDGLLDATITEDGDYIVRVNQFTYTVGSPEYFYRLSISTRPYIDQVFPPMIEAGKPAQVTLYGRNLPGGQLDPTAMLDGRIMEKLTVTITPPSDPQAAKRLSFSGVVPTFAAMVDGFEYRLKTPAGTSNAVLVMFAEAPVTLEGGDNDTPEKGQVVTLPCEIAGRIEKPGDRDWYTFTAKKGDVYMIDLLSHRLGVSTDMYLTLRNAEVKEGVNPVIASLDDDATTLATQPFYTASHDPTPYRFVVPADGKYQILVGNHLGDAVADLQHYYRLRLVPERPDFRLFVMPPDLYRPDTLVMGQGGFDTFNVYAWRRDGFQGDIALTIEGLPAGVTAVAQSIGPKMKSTPLVLSAAATAAAATGALKVKGKATIGGKVVEIEARPATITWPVQLNSNIPTITRLDQQLMLAIRDKAPYALTLGKDKEVISHGDKLKVTFKVNRAWPDLKAAVQAQPLAGELPTGLTIPATTIAADKTEGAVEFTVPATVQPGTYNIVFRNFAPVPFAKDPMAKTKPNVNVVQASQPLTLTVLPKQVATLTVDNANPSIKKGAEGAVLVKVARQFDYDGEFKVKLVLPAGIVGVAAPEIAIPAGQSEAKLMLRVPADAAPGARANLSVQATAVVNGNVTLLHEIKITVNVVN